MKRFFYLCAALLCLSLAFHFGYSTAKAQAPGNPLVALSHDPNTAYFWAASANGNIYNSIGGASWSLTGNVFSGPTPALQQSWGQLKARYAPSTEQTRPASPRDR